MELKMQKQRKVGTAKKQKDAKNRRMNKRVLDLEKEVTMLRRIVQDFIDYFEPRGGVTQVPLGPFERASEETGIKLVKAS